MFQIRVNRSFRIHKQISKHYKTSSRFKIKNVFEFFEKKNITLFKFVKLNIFQIMNVKISTEYVILAKSDRIRHNNSNINDLRNFKQKMIEIEIAKIDKIFEKITIDNDVLF